MKPVNQKLCIRLLKPGMTSTDAVIDAVAPQLQPFDIASHLANSEHAHILPSPRERTLEIGEAFTHIDSAEAKSPQWTKLWDTSGIDTSHIKTITAFGILLCEVRGHWFAITFGHGYAKLNLDNYVQNFGLKVVLNMVDPTLLKTIDMRQPGSNTIQRRNQVSRSTDQRAFQLIRGRDILRGEEGTPIDKSFAASIAGTDALTFTKKLYFSDIPQLCADALDAYGKKIYRESFAWVDDFDHIRDNHTIEQLNIKLAKMFAQAQKTNKSHDLLLSLPELYDPHRHNEFAYVGDRSRLSDAAISALTRYPELDIIDCLEHYNNSNVTISTFDDLHDQRVVQFEANNVVKKWRLSQLLGCEIRLRGDYFVHFGGSWYQIKQALLDKVTQTLESRTITHSMPNVHADEKEDKYLNRLRATRSNGCLVMHCRFITSEAPESRIEICDIMTPDGSFWHVKYGLDPMQLSYLFSQGARSAEAFFNSSAARAQVMDRVREEQEQTGRSGFDALLQENPDAPAAAITVVCAVITDQSKPKLSFLTLLDFERVVEYIEGLGFKCNFAWIKQEV